MRKWWLPCSQLQGKAGIVEVKGQAREAASRNNRNNDHREVL